MRRVRCDAAGVAAAVQTVRDGGVVVYPTDTVYGIGCDPYSASAVERVRRIKRRRPDMPLPVLAWSIDDVARVAVISPAAGRLAEEFWPGGLTLILRLRDARLGRSMGIRERIAVRVPGCECTTRMLLECRYVVGTSANISGKGPQRDPRQVRGMDGCDTFVDGGTTPGGESTIVDASGDTVGIVREGAVPPEEVWRSL
jgi:L-threonylcarbamoyladenylate synthase